MSRTGLFREVLLLGLLALAGLVVGAAAPAPDKPDATGTSTSAGGIPREGALVGPVSCASSACHGSVRARDVFKKSAQTEYVTWLRYDKHPQAYKVLYNDLSATIVRNLPRTGSGFKEAYERERCLVCHSVYDPVSGGEGSYQQAPGQVPFMLRQAQHERKTTDEFNTTSVCPKPLEGKTEGSSATCYVSEGVSCEACHGPAGGWLVAHVEEGFSKKGSGMKDLEDLETRAKVCLGCHLGDPDNLLKTVDHELMAAGHPNLSFELDNYTAALPPHWKEKDDKDPGRNVRIWAMGQVVAFRESLLQLARRARSDRWPEFAEMNCYECHHTLRPNSWRLGSRAEGKSLGLPRWNAARFAMLRHFLATFAPQQYENLSRETEKLANDIQNIDTPPDVVADSATKLADSMNKVVERIETTPLNGLPASLVQRISTDVPYLVNADLGAVEQAVMSINALVIAGELTTDDTKGIIDKLYDDVEKPDRFDPEEFKEHMRQLEQQMSAP